MFGFGSSRKALRNNDVFEDADVQELTQTFPHKTSLDGKERGDPNELLLLASGKGFIIRSALSRLLQEELGKTDGRLVVASLAERLDITTKELLRLVHEDDSTFLSKDGKSVLTRPELKSLVKELKRNTEQAFVPATVFAEKWNIDRKDLIRIVEISDEEIKEGPLQLLQDPRASSISSESTSYPYIHTLSLLLKTKEDLTGKMESAQAETRPVSWTFSEMSGLSKKALCRLAESLFPPADETNAIHGDFESCEDGMRFVPHSYILRKVKHHVKEVARGDKPYCDLENLTKLYPKVLSDVQSARDFVETAAHDRNGSPLRFHFISHYAIGNSSLNSTARTNLEKLGAERFTNTKPYLRAFPREIHDEVRVLLHNRTILYYRENGANRGDLVALGDWLVLVAFITDLVSAATRLGRSIADEQWKTQSESPTFVPTLSPSRFLERFHEESETPLELLQRLWEIKRNESISATATIAFEKRIADLQKESQDQFNSLWLTRVVLKSLLYTAGLEALPASSLKDQLSEILSTYLCQDLIPSTIKRARTKGMIRTPNLSKQISKLETEIAPTITEKKSSYQEMLFKFARKISLDSPMTTEMAAAKQEHLNDILAAMSKDKDGPRLFLSLMIVLCASKKEGVIYATGKFAPKLLKAIKGELEGDIYKRTEDMKELVKLGKVDEFVRVEMREIAIKAVKGLSVENGEVDAEKDVKTEVKAGNKRWQTIYGDGSDVSLKTVAAPLAELVRKEMVWGENGEGWISRREGHDSKINPQTKEG